MLAAHAELEPSLLTQHANRSQLRAQVLSNVYRCCVRMRIAAQNRNRAHKVAFLA